MDRNSIYSFNNEFTNKIQENRPVYVFNFDPDNKQGILISYLLYLDFKDLENKFDKYIDIDGINNDSILFFDKHHIIELSQMYYGYFRIITKSNDEKTYVDKIYKISKKLYNPIKFKDLFSYMDAICLTNPEVHNDDIIQKVKLINKCIWFVPYSKIDELILEAVDIYEKENLKDGDKNDV